MRYLCLLLLLGLPAAQAVEFAHDKESIVRGLRLPLVSRGARGPAGVIAQPKVAALILFDFDSSRIKSESVSILQNYGQVLAEDLAGAVISIVGHTDSDGSAAYNLNLSRQRAAAVRRYLLDHFNIEAARLRVQGLGESRPLLANNSPAAKAKNRRVEFVRVGSVDF